MGQEPTQREKIIKEYHETVEPFLSYVPWLEEHAGETGQVLFGEQGISTNSLSFPVFDGTLMRFVKEVGKSSLMDRNYRYVYSRNHLKSHEDERRLIRATNWRSWDQLKGILSWYVLGGRVKAALWGEGVKSGISETTGERQIDIVKLKKMITVIIRITESAVDLTVAATGIRLKNTAQIGRQMMIYGILLPHFECVLSLLLPKYGWKITPKTLSIVIIAFTSRATERNAGSFAPPPVISVSFARKITGTYEL